MFLKSWTGKSFLDWCDEYDGDTRMIHLCIYCSKDGKQNDIYHFSSNDYVDSIWVFQLHKAIIRSIELNRNEWWISLGIAT